MEGYAYTPSYPDSGDSSPRSREIEFDNPPPWEDPLNPQSTSSFKVKFMCSYGGKIHPRPHDNQLSYVGGETKILVVDRNIKFSALLSKLSGMCDSESVSFKYQLPGEDLDALISVTNDEDLENMLQEYDRLYKASPKPARLRLFLFGGSTSLAAPPSNSSVGTGSFGSDEGMVNKSEKDRFVEALNSGPFQPPPPLSAVAAPPIPAGNVDFLFGLEKEMPQPPHPQQLQQPPHHVAVGKAQQPVDPLDVPVTVLDDKLAGSDPIQKHIQDLQKLRLEAQQQQVMYHRNSDDDLSGGFPVSAAGEYYVQKLPDKVSQMTVPAAFPVQQGGGAYRPEKQINDGVFRGTEPLYMIPPPAGAYGHSQMVRPVTGPTNQGYYTLQRLPMDAYRDQQMQYNIFPSMPANVQPVAAPPPTLAPPKVSAYSEGYGVMRQGGTSGGIGNVESGGYAPVAYDGGIGRQVYYTAQGGVMAGPPPPQAQQHAAAAAQYHPAIASGISGEMKALNQEAVKVVGKQTQASV